MRLGNPGKTRAGREDSNLDGGKCGYYRNVQIRGQTLGMSEEGWKGEGSFLWKRADRRKEVGETVC